MSSSAEGIIKIWNIKKQSVVNTFEEHDDKIWAMDNIGSTMITGGADSVIKIWRDNTEETEL